MHALRLIATCLVVVSTAHTAMALHEDQAGVYDWHQQYVGHIHTAVSLDDGSLVVGSSFAVSKLDGHTGEVVWRQVVDGESDGGVHTLVGASSKSAISLSRSGRFVRRWKPSGALAWESVMPSTCEGGGVAVRVVAKDTTVVQVGRCVRAIDTSSGKTRWDVSIASPRDQDAAAALVEKCTEVAGVYATEDRIALACTTIGAKGVVLALLSRVDGTPVSSEWLEAPLGLRAGIVFTEDGALIAQGGARAELLAARVSGATRTFAGVPTSQLLRDTACASSSPSCTESSCTVQLVAGPGTNLFTVRLPGARSCSLIVKPFFDGNTFTVVSAFAQGGASAALGDTEFVHVDGACSRATRYNRVTGRPVSSTSSSSSSSSSESELSGSRTTSFVSVVSMSTTKLRLVCVTNDWMVHMLDVSSTKEEEGSSRSVQVDWSRDEALSRVLFAEFVDPTVRGSVFQTLEHEFGISGDPSASIVGEFVARITGQVEGLVRLFGAGGSSSSGSDEEFARDAYGTRKAVVVATASGRVYALHSLTGAVLWVFDMGLVEPQGMYLQRTTNHGSALVTLVVRETMGARRWRVVIIDGLTGMEIHTSDPTTALPLADNDKNGNVGEQKALAGTPLAYRVEQAVLLSSHDTAGIAPLLLLGDDGLARVIPNTAAARDVVENGVAVYAFAMEQDGRRVAGVRVGAWDGATGFALEDTWSMRFPGQETSIAVRAPHERVSTVGRVLGDRNVLYKYLNTNMVAFATVSETSADGTTTSDVTVYVVDVVKGTLLHRAVISGGAAPVRLVQSENWLVCTYFHGGRHTAEAAVWELFAPRKMVEQEHVSSFQHTVPQTNYTQSFLLGTRVRAIGVTTTHGGLAGKAVLLGLVDGRVLAVPKSVLDPRRPLDPPTPEQTEELLVQYHPLVPVHPAQVLNYNQTVTGLRHIFTAPTSLESTCLVFAVGHDLFLTRSRPAGSFDVLSEEFNKPLLVLMTLALVGSTVATWVWQQRVRLARQWK